MSSVPEGDVESFVAGLEAADEEVARAVVTSIVATHANGVRMVIDKLIPAALEHVGSKWESAEWTVAQEHLATDICDRIVATMAREIDTPVHSAHSALVVCAEGEWHSLASRTVDVSLQLAGWRSQLLGPSVSSSQLAAAIFDNGPDFVAMTCSMVANLPGAVRMIETARETRTPILVGGRAFGDSADRALRLGADDWADDSAAVATFVERLDSFSPSEPLASVHDSEVMLLESGVRDIVLELSRRLGIDHALDGEFAAGGVWMLRTLHAALLCDERHLLIEQMRWHEGRARLDGALPAAVVVRALLGALPAGSPEAYRWLEESAFDAGVRL